MTAPKSEFISGWRVLLGSAIGIAAGVSSLYFYSLGIFIKPLAAEFGWPRSAASLGAMVGTVAAAIMSPVMGRIADRYGSRKVALASLAMLALGFAAHALLIAGLASFLAVTFVVSLLTAGSSPVPYTRLTIANFALHRGLALGIVLAGTGAGAIMIPEFLAPFVAAHGWRAGYLALAVVAAACGPLVALLLYGARDPAQSQIPGQAERWPIGAIVHVPGFARLAVLFGLAAVAILGTVVQFVPMLGDAGMTPGRAGGIVALIGVAAIGGRLVVGLLLDRFNPGLITAGLLLAAAAGLLLLGVGGVAMAIPGALITGLAVGAEVDLMSFLTARYYPTAAFGQANGLLYAVFLAGGAIGPVLSGAFYDLTGNYRVSLIVASGLLVCAGLIGLRLPSPTPLSNVDPNPP